MNKPIVKKGVIQKKGSATKSDSRKKQAKSSSDTLPAPKKASASRKKESTPLIKTVAPAKTKPAFPSEATPKSSDVSLSKAKQKQSSAGPRYGFSAEIPNEYGETYMRALPRDPEWTYVYWEFTPATINSLKKYMGIQFYESSKRILRLLDITDVEYNGSNAWHHYDFEINSYANTWFLKIPEPGRTYLIECGQITEDGKFYLIIRSNTFSVPRASVSLVNDEEWTTVSTDELIAISANALKGGIGSSERNAGIAPFLNSSPGNTSPGKWQ
jgi:hypothetical protein